MEFKLTDIITYNALLIYSAGVTVTLLIILWNKRKSTHKYKRWKIETINLLVYKREYHTEPDEFMLQLWNECEKVKAENTVINKKYNQLSLHIIIIALIGLAEHSIKNLGKKFKKEEIEEQKKVN